MTSHAYHHPIGIHAEDIDHMGHVNNSVYLKWVQEAVVHFWEKLAPPEAVARHLWIALSHEISYRRPTFLDDLVVADVIAEKVDGAQAPSSPPSSSAARKCWPRSRAPGAASTPSRASPPGSPATSPRFRIDCCAGLQACRHERQIRVGIGGWTYPPWRGTFYPDGLPQAESSNLPPANLAAIEINATFYGRQSPKSWENWAQAAPDGFQFAVKGSRFCVTRPKLADAGEGVGNFLAQGLTALGDKLGPILWMLAPRGKNSTGRTSPRFLALLPRKLDGVRAAPCHRAAARKLPRRGLLRPVPRA